MLPEHFGYLPRYLTSFRTVGFENTKHVLSCKLSIFNHCFECCNLCLQMPLHAAALEDKDKFFRLLLRYSADISRTDASGETPVDLASKNRCARSMVVFNEKLGRLVGNLSSLHCG